MTPKTMKAFMCYPYLKVIFEVVRSFFTGEHFKVSYVSFAKHKFLTHLDTKYFNNYSLCILLLFCSFCRCINLSSTQCLFCFYLAEKKESCFIRLRFWLNLKKIPHLHTKNTRMLVIICIGLMRKKLEVIF